MLPDNVNAALREHLGIDPRVFHRHHIEYVWRKRMAEHGFSQDAVFAEILLSRPDTLREFCNEIYTPATWFFRHKPAFDFLEYWLADQWLPAHQGDGRRLRVLSYPCASGEEVYSLMMTALDAGMKPEQLDIIGCDTRDYLLGQAGSGAYRESSFNPRDIRECERYFNPYGPEDFVLHPDLTQHVSFVGKNPLEASRSKDVDATYDMIFCRNFLVYLAPEYRQRLIRHLMDRLSPEGLLFAGNSDNLPAIDGRFRLLGAKGSYAYTFDASASPRPKKDASIESAEQTRVLPEDEVSYTREQTHRNACELAENGFYEEAEYICHEYLEKTGPSAEIFFLLGKIYDAEGQSEKSEAAFRKCVYLENGHPEAYDALAMISEKRGHIGHAEELRKRGTRSPFARPSSE